MIAVNWHSSTSYFIIAVQACLDFKIVCFSSTRKKYKTDVLLFFRDYCNDVKKSENNTEFLLNFNEFIDRNTPSSPSCKYTSQLTEIFP